MRSKEKLDNSSSATHWRKKPVVIQAHRWFKNGDHPEDNSGRMRPEVEYCEGAVVRYFRHPTIDGKALCSKCGNAMYGHGWIDTLEDGHNVCPGDWIITGVKGEHYPCKPDIFDLTYEPASTVSETAPLVAGDLAKQREIHDSYAPVSAIALNPHQLATEETDKLLLSAWTGFEHSYPQYFNATMVRMKGHVILSVRLHGGACSSVRFTREAWNEFANQFEAMNSKYQAADSLDAI